MRYRLRTLLILLAVAPPFIAAVVQYRQWRDDRLWRWLEIAKRERDDLLKAWRSTHDLVLSGQASALQETDIQQRYYAARQEVDDAMTTIRARYGNTDKQLLRAMQAQRARKSPRY